MDVGGKEAGRWGGRVFGALLFIFCAVPPAHAEDIEVVTSRFSDLPANEPIFIDNANMGEDDEAIAARIAEMLRLKGLKVLDEEPDGDGDNLVLTFELDRFVPAEAQVALADQARRTPALTTHIYPGAHHAFARSEGVHFHADASALAQQRTEQFLQRHLRG